MKMSNLREFGLASICVLAAMSAAMVRADVQICSTVQGGCVAPVGARPLLPSEEEAVQEIQCRLACIRQSGIDLEATHDYPAWPNFKESRLEANCAHYQKVQECQSGCTIRSRDPTLTVNRCRDSCYSSCQDACGGHKSCDQPGTTCKRNCRRTFCRLGCVTYNTVTSPDRDSIAMLSPISPPSLTPAGLPSSLPGQLHVNLSSAMPQAQPAQEPRPAIGYVFRVQALDGDRVGFVWKPDLESPLDLSAFACLRVSVSFRVASEHGLSEYSPTAELCIGGVSGVPGQVEASSIEVHYSEDLRPDFRGFAVATITWDHPAGHEFLSFYKLTIRSESQECGGSTPYDFTGIHPNTTEFVLEGAYMKFGCSYTLTILTLPAQQHDTGTHKSIAPSLSLGAAPKLDLQCSRIWHPQGHFSILATWTIPNSSLLVEAIKRFSLNPMLRYTTKWGLFAVVKRFPSQTVRPENGVYEYSVQLDNFLPRRGSEIKYYVELRTEGREELFWRRTPQTQSCSVPSTPIPPLPLNNITISTSEVTSDGPRADLRLRLHWQPPEAAYGEVSQYELRIGEAASHGESAVYSLYMDTFPASTTSAFIETSFNLTTDSTHCLHLQMRSYNEFVPSNWSDPLVLAVDEECVVTTNHSNTTEKNESCERITIHVENGNGSVRVIEVECGRLEDGSNPESVDEQLKQLEERLQIVGQLQSSTQAQLSSIDERIDNIEQQLSALEGMLARSRS